MSWSKYGLGITLVALFLLSWFAQGVAEWFVVAGEAQQHGQRASVLEYLAHFTQATMENWQSEFLQLATFVILAKYLIFKGSPQSKDGDDEMRAALLRIERKLDGHGEG